MGDPSQKSDVPSGRPSNAHPPKLFAQRAYAKTMPESAGTVSAESVARKGIKNLFCRCA